MSILISVDNIDTQIEELKKKIDNIEGTECTIFTRIVGYYRATKNWNIGQAAQRLKRVNFKVPQEIPIQSDTT